MYQINKNLSDRINVLKFLSIIMVVFIHSYTEGVSYDDLIVELNIPEWLQVIKYIVSQSVSRVAVPLFFLISSILLYSKEFTFKNNMKKKCSSILLPYIFWNTVWILLYLTAQSISIIAPYFSNKIYYVRDFSLEEWIKAFLYFNGNTPFLYPFWFLRDLFILNIFSLIIKKIIDKFPKISLILITFMWFSGHSIPYLDSQAIVFFALGYYIIKYQLNVKLVDKINRYLIIFTYAIFIILDYVFRDSYLLFHNVNIIVGIIFFMKMSNTIINNNKLSNTILYFSKYTFIIYAFHEMNLTIFRKLITRILPQTGIIQLLEYFTIPIVIILGCIVFGYVFNKISPKVYKYVTGGR